MNKSTKQKSFVKRCLGSAKVTLLLFLLLFGVMQVQAQLSVSVTNPGNATPALSSSYSSLLDAITALNSSTAFSGQVILTCSGTSETAPVGGFRIAFTGTTTGTNNVIIDGSSTTVTAPSLSATTAGVRTDAIFKIVGSDYVTIQNFTMTENAANTTGGAIGVQKMTEFGVALFARDTINGAQYNTIKNNTITLSSATKYQNAIGIFSSTASSETNATQAATSVAGTNSFNMIYGNTISGVATGIYFVSRAQTATIFDLNLKKVRNDYIANYFYKIEGFEKWIWDFALVQTGEVKTLLTVDESGELKSWQTDAVMLSNEIYDPIK